MTEEIEYVLIDGQIYAKRIKMDTNKTVHEEEKPYKCSICSAAFTCEKNLRIHAQLSHTSMDNLQLETFPSNPQMTSGEFNRVQENSSKSVHDEKKQNEKIKDEPSNDYEKVKETQTSSKDQKFKCRLCEFESDDKKATTTHVQLVHEGKKHDAIKPRMSNDDLIAEAINNSSNGMLEVSDIYNAISTKYPYYKIESKYWQNCIRHNLSLSNLFVKEGNTKGGNWKLDEKEFIEFKKARELKHTNRLKHQISGHIGGKVLDQSNKKTVREEKNVYKCTFCDQTFDTTSNGFAFELKKHLKWEHKDQIAWVHEKEKSLRRRLTNVWGTCQNEPQITGSNEEITSTNAKQTLKMVHERKKHDAIKPKRSYKKLIAEALISSSNGMLLSDIYKAISTKYPFYKLDPICKKDFMDSKCWQNCIRYNLFLSDIFKKESKYWKLDEKKFIEFKKARRLKKNCRAIIPALLSDKEGEKEYKQKKIDMILPNPFPDEVNEYEKIRETWTVSEKNIFKNKMKIFLNPTKCPQKSCECPKKSCNDTLLDKHLGSKKRPKFDSEFLKTLEQKSVKNCIQFYYLTLPSLYNLEKRYCLCRGPAMKDMIGCSFCLNWFHQSCLKLSDEKFEKAKKMEPWKCPYCPYFCKSVRLKKFENFINYHCVPCKEYFASKKLKKYHEEKNHKEKNHKEKNQEKNSACKLCNKIFDQPDLLQRHIANVHSPQMT